MKPGTKAMNVSAHIAKSGCVKWARSFIHARARNTLNVVQAIATERAITNLTRTET